MKMSDGFIVDNFEHNDVTRCTTSRIFASVKQADTNCTRLKPAEKICQESTVSSGVFLIVPGRQRT